MARDKHDDAFDWVEEQEQAFESMGFMAGHAWAKRQTHERLLKWARSTAGAETFKEQIPPRIAVPVEVGIELFRDSGGGGGGEVSDSDDAPWYMGFVDGVHLYMQMTIPRSKKKKDVPAKPVAKKKK